MPLSSSDFGSGEVTGVTMGGRFYQSFQPSNPVTLTNEFRVYQNLLRTNEENDMENRQQLIERALRYVFKHKATPDYSNVEWHDEQPIQLYTNKWGNIILYNNTFKATLAIVDPRNKKIVCRLETVYLAMLQDFADLHGYKLYRPPQFPRLGDTTIVFAAPELYTGEPMLT